MNISYEQKELNYGKLINGIVVNMVVIWFLYVMSAGMWGSVTFRKHPFILTYLVHVIFLLALVAVPAWLGNKLFGAEPQMKPDELSFYGGEDLPQFGHDMPVMGISRCKSGYIECTEGYISKSKVKDNITDYGH